MLQVEAKVFASDALEQAMTLAQTKALNSYSWSDMFNYLNYTFSDVYNRLAMIDDGYYSINQRINSAMTKLPPFVKNTIKVYAAQDVVGFNREVYRSSGMNDLKASQTYHISGFDLYCPDATRRKIWLNFVPAAQLLFFTLHNRDPKLYEENVERVESKDYHLYTLQDFKTEINKNYMRSEDPTVDGRIIFQPQKLLLAHKNQSLREFIYLTPMIYDIIKDGSEDPDWDITYLSCDYPYIFVTYINRWTKKHVSGFYKDILHHVEFTRYNPFDFTGRETDVEYIKTSWNDKTGMGVIVRDYNDYDTKEKRYRIKELGWTPDSILNYPCPEAFRFVVARLADKFSALNESNVMGVAKELTEAKYAFEAFCAKDKSSFQRIDNVNGPYITDWL